VIYASTTNTQPPDRYPYPTPGSVWTSADGGETWIDLHLTLFSGATSIDVPDDGSRIFAATGLGVYTLDLRRPVTLPARWAGPGEPEE
jgi:hypothetical protein